MRSQILAPFHLLLCLTALCLTSDSNVSAQTFTTLHTFTAGSGFPSYTNSDGAYPGGLIISGNTLYGTTGQGGIFGRGTIFRVNIDGSGFANLHTFTALSAPYYTNDGAFAAVSLIAGNTLYGTAHEGGPLRTGTIFAINTDDRGFTNLYNFPYDGAAVYPFGLILSGNTFYGAASGGSSRAGTLFRVNTGGTGFSLLYDFAPTSWNSTLRDFTNSDGTFPAGGVILSGNTLYGTAYTGGSSVRGTVYKVNTDGTGFTTLHSFTALDAVTGTNEDGANPPAGLILSGNTLYGTAMGGGSSGNGTVFKVNTDGTGFTTLHSFTRLDPPNYFTNSDGANPHAVLVLFGNILYGTAPYGGSFGRGTVFAVNTDGLGFVTLHHFRGSDGIGPSKLLLSSNTLYGTTSQGGSFGNGTVFSLSLPRLVMTCPQPLILECTNGTAAATLDLHLEYSGSNPVVVVWTVDGTPYQTNNLPPVSMVTSTHLTFTADFALGEHLVTVSASNGAVPSTTCSIPVKIQDTIAPAILSVLAMPNILWPPNNQMVSVTIQVHAMDNCGPTTCRIVAMTSNQAANSPGHNNGSDWVITGDLSADLKAKRLGNGRGLTYTIWIACADVAGNSSLGSVTVTVPHDQR